MIDDETIKFFIGVFVGILIVGAVSKYLFINPIYTKAVEQGCAYREADGSFKWKEIE